MIKIAIDPGHGGSDPGAVSGELKEKDINLDIALKLNVDLTSRVQVLLTRDKDIALGKDIHEDLQARCQMANSWGADFFLSIHCNAFKNPSVNGVETWIVEGAHIGTRIKAGIIHRYLVSLGFTDRGIKEDRTRHLYVLRNTAMPAALVEIGFITNPGDSNKLMQPGFRLEAARALAEALREAFNIKPSWPEIAAKEIQKLKEDNLITGDHKYNAYVTWGEFAAMLNRLRGRE